jgi:hypothetical protein
MKPFEKIEDKKDYEDFGEIKKASRNACLFYFQESRKRLTIRHFFSGSDSADFRARLLSQNRVNVAPRPVDDFADAFDRRFVAVADAVHHRRAELH